MIVRQRVHRVILILKLILELIKFPTPIASQDKNQKIARATKLFVRSLKLKT